MILYGEKIVRSGNVYLKTHMDCHTHNQMPCPTRQEEILSPFLLEERKTNKGEQGRRESEQVQAIAAL